MVWGMKPRAWLLRNLDRGQDRSPVPRHTADALLLRSPCLVLSWHPAWPSSMLERWLTSSWLSTCSLEWAGIQMSQTESGKEVGWCSHPPSGLKSVMG